MKFGDFMGKLTRLGLNSHFVQKISYLLLRNTSDDEIFDTIIDDAVFEKIELMRKNSVPDEIIWTALRNSLDWYNRLDVRKFWHNLGSWNDKVGMSKQEIKQDIEKYKNSSHKQSEKIPLMTAVRRLVKIGFDKDFVVDKLLNYAVDPATADNEIEDMFVDGDVLDTVLRMHEDGWSEKDIIRELEKQVDGKPGFDTRKFSRSLPKELVVNKRKISALDGSIKPVNRIGFLKYLNPVLKFFAENINQIAELSNRYKDDNEGFARAFYNLYVNFRGWGNFAPEFTMDIDEKATRKGGFNPEGFFLLKDLSSQETIVNIIIHELIHFEQYLMLINTPDIGLTPFVKEHIMDSFLNLSNAYADYDKHSRVVFYDKDFKDFKRDDMPFLMSVARQRFENDFYHNALKIPHKEITPQSPEYATVEKLADSFATTYNHENRGNTRFVYPNLFSEQIAFDIGNAAAVMFRNIIMRERTRTTADLNKILDFASRDC